MKIMFLWGAVKSLLSAKDKKYDTQKAVNELRKKEKACST